MVDGRLTRRRWVRWLVVGAFGASLGHLAACSETAPPPASKGVSEDTSTTPSPTALEQALGLTVIEMLETEHLRPRRVEGDIVTHGLNAFLQKNDPHKLLLLAEHVEKIRGAKADRDAYRRGQFPPVDAAMDVLPSRLEQARTLGESHLSTPLDLTVEESLEVDVDKRDFCTTEKDLADRWRRALKLDVLRRMARREMPQADAQRQVAQTWADRLKTAPLRLEQIDLWLNSLASVFDPHTAFLPPARKAQFDATMSGSVVGVGVILQVRAGVIFVADVLAGSPAFDKVQVGDRVLSVTDLASAVTIKAGSSADARTLSRLINHIWGPLDSKVLISVERDGKTREIELSRKLVTDGSTFARGVVTRQRGRRAGPMGYVRLPRFYGDTRNPGKQVTDRRSAADMRRIVTKLKKAGARGIVIDLRNNSGGFLEDAGGIAGLFLPPGAVAQVRSPGKPPTLVRTDPAMPTVWAGPLVVLVNHKTASSAEVLAAALQDHRRAVIVGTAQTYGKGSLQRVAPLANLLAEGAPAELADAMGVLKITRQQVFRITGSGLQRRGVSPDIRLPDIEHRVARSERDRPHALAWESAAGLAFQPVGDAASVAAAKAKSLRRRQGTDAVWGALERRTALQATFHGQTQVALSRAAYNARRLSHQKALDGTVLPSKARFAVTELPGEPSLSWRALQQDVWVEEALSVLADLAK